MKRVYIIQGFPHDNNIEEAAIKKVKELYPQESFDIKVQVSKNDKDSSTNKYLGEMLDELVSSDIVYFGKRWNLMTIAQLEYKAAIACGIEIIKE